MSALQALAPPRLRVLVLLLALPAGPLAAQSPARTLVTARTSAPPRIDGRLDDAAWSQASVASGFVQHRPRPGAPATQDAEVRVLHDDDALYVAVRNRDARPDSVVGRLARRDQAVYSDWFTVLVDSYQDRRTAFAFSVNPRGVQRDWAVVDDGQEDDGWDAVWAVATAVDVEGWTAELRIPFSQLRFTAATTGRGWGINFARTLARADELSYWSPVAPDVTGLVSQFGTLAGLRDVPAPRRLELQPYTMARVTRAPGEDADPFFDATALGGAVGGDLRYGIGAGLTLSATINPDFGQVEADPSEVNLTAFETFLQERRPFFAEGADIFGIGFPQLLYSRRIGARPRGRVPGGAAFADVPEQTTILGAVKLTGRTAGGWSIGVLDAVTAREEARWVDTATDAAGRAAVEPRANFLALRARRDFRGGRSALGAIATAVNRQGGGTLGALAPGAAYVVGVDGRWRFAGDRYEVGGNLLGSWVRGSTTAIADVQRSPVRFFQRADADHVSLDTTRTALAGAAARLSLGKVGGSLRWSLGALALTPGFEPNDLGFLSQADELRAHAYLSYERFRAGRVLRSWMVDAMLAEERTFGGEPLGRELRLGARAQLLNQWGGYMFLTRTASTLDVHALRGGPALRTPAGTSGSFTLSGDPRRALRVELDGRWAVEDAGGARSAAVGPVVSVRPTAWMELALTPTLAWNRDPAQYLRTLTVDGAPTYLVGALVQRTQSLTLRLDYTFSPALSLQLHAEPFVSAGRFGALRTVRDARAGGFADRFRTLGDAEVTTIADDAGTRHALDLTGDGAPDAELRDPSFTVRRFASNAVLRWEYRPGSTIYVAWSQGRQVLGGDGRLDLGRDLSSLFGAPGTNVLMVKASYWLGM